MNPAPSLPPPRGYRLAAIACLVLYGLTGVVAANQTRELTQLENNSVEIEAAAAHMPDPEVFREVNRAYVDAMQPMVNVGLLIQGALATLSAFGFVCTLRLLRPNGLPREPIRRLLTGCLVFTSVLCTVNGAQAAVVLRKAAEAAARIAAARKELEGMDTRLIPSLAVGGVALWTAGVIAVFLVINHYFRSPSVREYLERSDQLLE